MENNDLVQGFDYERDDSLKISLKSCDEIKSCIIVQLTGYIDTYNSSFLNNQFVRILEAGFYNLIIDCTNLTYVSSTGIGVFSVMLKNTKQHSGGIVLFNLKETVSEVFQLLGFYQLFNIKNTEEEAVAFFRQDMQATVSIFPKIFSCPVCSKRLRTSCAGRFRCSECKSIIAVDGNGQIQLG